MAPSRGAGAAPRGRPAALGPRARLPLHPLLRPRSPPPAPPPTPFRPGGAEPWPSRPRLLRAQPLAAPRRHSCPEKPASSWGRQRGCPRGGWRWWLSCPARPPWPGSLVLGLPAGPAQVRPPPASSPCLTRNPPSLSGARSTMTLPGFGARSGARRCSYRRCSGARPAPALPPARFGGLPSSRSFALSWAVAPGSRRSGCRSPGPRGPRCPGRSCPGLRPTCPHRGSEALGVPASPRVAALFLSSCGGRARLSSLLLGGDCPPGAPHGRPRAHGSPRARVPEAGHCLASPEPLAAGSRPSPLRWASRRHQGSPGLPRRRDPRQVPSLEPYGPGGGPRWPRHRRWQTRTPAPPSPASLVPRGTGALCPFSRPWRAQWRGLPGGCLLSPSLRSGLPQPSDPVSTLPAPPRFCSGGVCGLKPPPPSPALGVSINNAGGCGS